MPRRRFPEAPYQGSGKSRTFARVRKKATMLRIGVFGVGHLGKIHLKCIQLAGEYYALAGFHDPDDEAARAAQALYGARRFDDPDALIDAVDVVDIVTPTHAHFELAARAIERGKHLFIEKPLTQTLEQGAKLVALSKAYEVKVQVGHVERFNPALLALGDMPLRPMFIEAHRLAIFNPRGADVSVVHDLMIHDLDIVLSMVDAELRHISASGVAVVSQTPDIANARLEFANGCVANLTASRISLKQMRKVRLFQRDAYISLDLLEKSTQIVRLYAPEHPDLPKDGALLELPTSSGPRYLHAYQPEIEPVNAIRLELESFARCIGEDSPPKVSVEDGYRALALAHGIAEEIEKRMPPVAAG
jgi:predicted dehydrogenase